jgi:nitroreductase
MMTGAAAAGIDSCAIEGYKEEDLLRFLGEDQEAWRVGILVVFGLAEEKRRDRIREPLETLAELR